MLNNLSVSPPGVHYAIKKPSRTASDTPSGHGRTVPRTPPASAEQCRQHHRRQPNSAARTTGGGRTEPPAPPAADEQNHQHTNKKKKKNARDTQTQKV